MLDDDWRLRNARDSLAGSEVQHLPYKMPRPSWDHDHCILCWQKIAEPQTPDSVHDGYVLPNQDWICPDCFETFADRLNLRVKNNGHS
jgi:hypothetical protein